MIESKALQVLMDKAEVATPARGTSSATKMSTLTTGPDSPLSTP